MVFSRIPTVVFLGAHYRWNDVRRDVINVSHAVAGNRAISRHQTDFVSHRRRFIFGRLNERQESGKTCSHDVGVCVQRNSAFATTLLMLQSTLSQLWGSRKLLAHPANEHFAELMN
jgi:hypothetical protein